VLPALLAACATFELIAPPPVFVVLAADAAAVPKTIPIAAIV
jgi:hypothetical protein